MIVTILEIFLESIIVFLTLIILKSVTNMWKENKNLINLMMACFIIFLVFGSSIRILGYLDFSYDFTIGTGFQTYHALGLTTAAFQLIFIFYLRGWKRFYYFPVIISGFIIVGLIQYEFEIYFLTFAILSTFFSSTLFIAIGLKNRNGVNLMLGIFVLISGIGYMLYFQLIGIIVRLISLIILYLGTSNFIDKYILIDQKEKHRLKSVWISKLLVTED